MRPILLFPIPAFDHNDDLFAPVDKAEAALGQLLFYDPILSGNRNIACATCHHPKFATADGVALAIGEGGIGLGPERQADPAHMPDERIPRNAPALFNLGAYEFSTMFHDGRLQADPSQPGGIRTPMDADMVTGFASVLSAQTDVSGAEQCRNGRQLSRKRHRTRRAPRADHWQRRRVGSDCAACGGCARLHTAVRAFYPHINSGEDIAFTDISNAIAAFMAFEWRSDTAPFDAVLRGDSTL
ncbi:Methylamine utilization protein MauG [Nymphon striatum]|nr:Methylamine utilization protein MauG [Nymphon striatum]